MWHTCRVCVFCCLSLSRQKLSPAQRLTRNSEPSGSSHTHTTLTTLNDPFFLSFLFVRSTLYSNCLWCFALERNSFDFARDMSSDTGQGAMIILAIGTANLSIYSLCIFFVGHAISNHKCRDLATWQWAQSHTHAIRCVCHTKKWCLATHIIFWFLSMGHSGTRRRSQTTTAQNHPGSK